MADPAELQRITGLLEVLIRIKNRTIRDLERSLGFSAGTLGRILSGKIELKFRLLLDVLELLEVPPKTFFKMAYEIEDPEGEGYQAIISQLRRLKLPEGPTPLYSRAELETVIVETLAKLGVTGQPAASHRPTKPPGSRGRS
jgi:transcriptional regulator with XRE-family HTH domain